MFCSPNYSLLCPDTIMNNTSLEGQGCYLKEFIYSTSLLQSCSIINVSKYMAKPNEM